MVKVKKVLNYSPFHWRKDDNDGSHILKRTASLCFDIRHKDFDSTATVRFCGESTDGQGFRCDGLSVTGFQCRKSSDGFSHLGMKRIAYTT